jgi:O-antigen/teichoic acid export membrane protein
MIDTSAQNTLKNSLYNFIGFLVPIIILIFITPIIISHWGVKEYGVYIFLNTVVVFLGLLDLGVSIATSKHLIEYRSKGDENRVKNMLYSMNTIYLGMAFVYFIACITIGIIIQIFFINRVGPENNYLLIFFILGITVFINAMFANFSNILFTLQRNDLQVKIGLLSIVLSNIFMLILVVLGYNLIVVLISQFFITLIINAIHYFIAKSIFPIMQLKYLWVKEEIVKNYKFGLSIAFNNLASSSLVHFDKLLIPVFLGNAQLTYYGVPGSIATKISSISATFSSLLFPITVNLQALNNTEKIKRVYIRSARLITILSSAIALSIIFTADKILLYWLDESFVKQSVNVLILLVLTNFVLALYSPLTNLLTAMNKMKFLTTCSIIMAIINTAALFILLPRYGITGAALSYLISVLFIFWMFYYSGKKYFQISEKIYTKLLLKIFITLLPFYLLVKFLLYPLITSMFTLVIIGPSCVFLFILLYKILGFVENEDWEDFKLSSRKIIHKLNFKK